MARIVLNTFGSLGDLHPYLGVAIGLKARGHHPVVATAEVYRTKIEAEGVAFAPVRPNIGDMADDKAFLKKIWHPRRGTEFLLRDYIMPAVQDSFEDLLPVCQGADLLLTHSATYAAPLVAEFLKLPWLSVVLQPMVFFSRFDPPVLAPAPWLQRLNALGPHIMGTALAIGKQQTASWAKPVADLRQRIGLPASKNNPMFEGQFSPFGTLAWFSKEFAQPQPDWPPRTRITGFPFHDKRGAGLERWSSGDTDSEMQALARFLKQGPPPVLFTLGSSAVMEPGSFYGESFAAAQQLGLRAVLLAGSMARESFPQPVPESIHIASYAPYSEVMPLCAASVHQGGIGTTAQALRSGRPMIVVPWAHDQPDNASRIQTLGIGRAIKRSRYTTGRAATHLGLILRGESYLNRAREVSSRINAENGVEAACDAIEQTLQEN